MEEFHPVYTHYRGIPVSTEQLRSAFEDLGSFLGANLQQVTQLRQGFVFRTEPLPGGRQVRVATYDGTAHPGTPFEDIKIMAYSIGSDKYLLSITKPAPGAHDHEKDVANSLGLQRALIEVSVDVKVPASDGKYLCRLTPLLQALHAAGFTATSPELQGMTGEAAVRGLRETVPMVRPGATLSQIDEQWLALVNDWVPTWKFVAEDLEVTAVLHGGLPLTITESGEVRLPYDADGDLMTGPLASDPDGTFTVPRLVITIRRRNKLPYSPYPKVLSDVRLQQQAHDLTLGFVTLDLH